MRSGLLAALVLLACAHQRPGEYRALEKTGVECKYDSTSEGTRVDCRRLGHADTARAVMVREPGAALKGTAHGVGVAR